MAEGNSIINLGDLSKPATVLIQKISNAVEGVARPHQIKRVAKAEAAAQIIRTEAEIKVADLQRRAMRRVRNEEARKQANIESIQAKALPHLQENARPDKMEDDWIANFFERCRITSDAEMQELWGRILAGEANTPGSFSKRTVNLVATLDKADGSLFATLCGFAWEIRDLQPLIYDLDERSYQEAGITFGALMHLSTIGLVTFDGLRGFSLASATGGRVRYHDQHFMLEFESESEEANKLSLGHVVLTDAGKQLARICGAAPVPGFVDYVIRRWHQKGCVLSCPLP